MTDFTRCSGFSEAELLEHLPSLARFAGRFHTAPHDVDDLVQETVTKALANSEKFTRGTQLRSWLYTIMRNTFCTRFGLNRREPVGSADDAAVQMSAPATQEWTVRGRELEAAIQALPKHQREAFQMVFIAA